MKTINKKTNALDYKFCQIVPNFDKKLYENMCNGQFDEIIYSENNEDDIICNKDYDFFYLSDYDKLESLIDMSFDFKTEFLKSIEEIEKINN